MPLLYLARAITVPWTFGAGIEGTLSIFGLAHLVPLATFCGTVSKAVSARHPVLVTPRHPLLIVQRQENSGLSQGLWIVEVPGCSASAVVGSRGMTPVDQSPTHERTTGGLFQPSVSNPWGRTVYRGVVETFVGHGLPPGPTAA